MLCYHGIGGKLPKKSERKKLHNNLKYNPLLNYSKLWPNRADSQHRLQGFVLSWLHWIRL